MGIAAPAARNDTVIPPFGNTPSREIASSLRFLAKTVNFPCHRERKRGDPTEKVCDYVFRTLLQGIATVATLPRNDSE